MNSICKPFSRNIWNLFLIFIKKNIAIKLQLTLNGITLIKLLIVFTKYYCWFPFKISWRNFVKSNNLILYLLNLISCQLFSRNIILFEISWNWFYFVLHKLIFLNLHGKLFSRNQFQAWFEQHIHIFATLCQSALRKFQNFLALVYSIPNCLKSKYIVRLHQSLFSWKFIHYSVEITEILSHTFSAKLSWKQCFTKEIA